MSDKISVLYVDDEKTNLFIFEKIFSEKFKIITTDSAEDALSLLNQSTQVNVVISDMVMPGMNGVELISKARKKFPEIAYFILTGFAYGEDIKRALKENLIHSLFTKPFNEELIEEKIHEVLAR